jgi:hypothetical protein
MDKPCERRRASGPFFIPGPLIRLSVGILRSMKLLFTGDPGCSGQTLKRLMIIGEELAFMDRPSVTVGGGTMIGINSPLRQFEPAMQETQPSLKVYTPPVGPISPLHEEYARRDLANPAFRGDHFRSTLQMAGSTRCGCS